MLLFIISLIYFHFTTTVPTVPPQNVSIVSVSALSVTLSWLPPPMEHQNGLITGYIITIYRGNDQEQRKETTDKNTTFGSLSGNTHYTLYLAAKTDVGMGPFSDAVYFKTKIHGMWSPYRFRKNPSPPNHCIQAPTRHMYCVFRHNEEYEIFHFLPLCYLKYPFPYIDSLVPRLTHYMHVLLGG